MYVVYTLYSPLHRKIYIGYTSDLADRFLSHNEYSNKGFTKKYRPWIIIQVERVSDKKSALERERFWKSGRGRKLIWNLIEEIGIVVTGRYLKK